MTGEYPGELPLLVFDGDCAFCAKSVMWLFSKTQPAAEGIQYQKLDLAAYGTTERRVRHEMLWIPPHGAISGGPRAFARLLRTSPKLIWRLAGLILDTVPMRWLAYPVYRLIANNRQRMPGGTDACAIRIDSR